MTGEPAVPLRLPDDARPQAQRTRDRNRAEVQAARVAERGGDRQLLEEFADKVIEARQRGGRRGDREYARFARLDDGRVDGPILIVENEYILRADDLTDDQRQELIQSGAQPIDNLEDRVFRVHDERSSDEVKRGLTAPSRRVKEHFVTPMGPVMKAVVGPEPSDGLQAAAPQAAARTGPQIAVIDTGIPATPREDGWLASVPVTPENTDLLDDLPPEGRLDLGAGHGTFAAGIIQRLVPDAPIRAYRAMDSDGFGTEAMVAAAMVQAANDGAVIINLSLGLETDDDDPPIALEAAVELIREQWPQVLIVAAAGNYGHERPCWPAAFEDVVAVAGLDRKLKPAAWSSRGEWVDCSTIGEAVLSTFVEGTERDDVDPDEVADVYPRNAWAIWTGTSFAAPQIVGAVAQILGDDPAVSPREGLSRLLQGCPEVNKFGRVVKILPPI